MKYLLDTNICIYIINKRPSSIIDVIRLKKINEISISPITIAELYYGAEKSQYPDQNRAAILEFVIPFKILNFDYRSAFCYGTIRERLESQDIPIGPMDLLLAAQALAYDLIFVTNNVKEFKRIDKLRLENWLM